jgi:hypothetical protein
MLASWKIESPGAILGTRRWYLLVDRKGRVNMSAASVEKIIRKAVVDAEFREELFTNSEPVTVSQSIIHSGAPR